MAFGGKVPTPVAPKQPDPVRLPSPDDPETLLARKRAMQQEMAGRQGRESTQLAEKGPAYSRTTLG